MLEVSPRAEDTTTIGWETTTTISAEHPAINLASKSLDVAWLFELGTYYWSTQDITIDGQAYSAKIDPASFSGVTISPAYNGAERLHTLEDITIEIPDSAGDYTSADFMGLDVDIYAYVDDGTNAGAVRKFKFTVISAKRIYEVLYLTLQDKFAYDKFEKLFPDTELVQNIWASAGDSALGYCMPIPFGTAYIPLPSIFNYESITYENQTTLSVDADAFQILDSASGLGDFKLGYVTISGFAEGNNNGIFVVTAVSAGALTLAQSSILVDESAGESVTIKQNQRYYVLGEDTSTYTIEEVQSPDSFPTSTWNSTQYTFEQFTKATYKVFQALIQDADNDGTAESNGLFLNGSKFDPISTKYSRADTATITNPADIISDIIFGGSVDAAFYNNSVTNDGAFPVKKYAYEWASEILKSSNAALVIAADGERVIKNLVPTAHGEINTSNIISDSVTFDPIIANENYDGGIISIPKPDTPQHNLYNFKVGLGNSASTKPSNEILKLQFYQDSQEAQKMGILYFERVVGKKADINAKAWTSLITSNPDFAIGLSGSLYDDADGATIIPTSITIDEDMLVTIKGTQFNHELSVYDDLTPVALEIYADDSSIYWSQEPEYRPGYLTVSPSIWEGQFSSIEEAFTALGPNKAGIYLMNGTYRPANKITLPDFDVAIVGESKKGVVIETIATDNTFECTTTVANTYSFKNLTFDSQTDSTGYHVIHMEGGAFDLQVENCKFDLWDDGTLGISGAGDVGVYVSNDKTANVSFSNNRINGGSVGITAIDVAVAKISNGNSFDAQTSRAIYCKGYRAVVSNNIITDVTYRGIGFFDVTTTGSESLFCSGNRIAAKESFTTTGGVSLIDVNGPDFNHVNITNNNLRIYCPSSIIWAAGVLNVYYIKENVTISGNIIYIETADTRTAKGVRLKGVANSVISGNSIKTNQGSADSSAVGISVENTTYHTTSKNNISNNTIDLVNNTANEIGIFLDSEVTYCYGDGNITANVGTSIDNTGGASNNVVAKDV
jgi:hypothetical protein